MKKIILFLFILTRLTFGQVASKVWDVNSSSWKTIGTRNSLQFLGTPTVPTGAIVEWAKNTQTVSTEVDTVSITSASIYANFRVYSVDDTIEVSLSGSFATPRIAYPTNTVIFENISPATFPKIYIRRKGTGTAIYNYSGEGQ